MFTFICGSYFSKNSVEHTFFLDFSYNIAKYLRSDAKRNFELSTPNFFCSHSITQKSRNFIQPNCDKIFAKLRENA